MTYSQHGASSSAQMSSSSQPVASGSVLQRAKSALSLYLWQQRNASAGRQHRQASVHERMSASVSEDCFSRCLIAVSSGAAVTPKHLSETHAPQHLLLEMLLQAL